jgi:hypothetical protein
MTGLRVVHNIPGRLRLRLPVAAETEGLTEAVQEKSGVTGCQWSPCTRSLLVHYEPEHVSAAEIAASVAQHAGMDVAPGTVESPESLTGRAEAGSSLSTGVRAAVGEIDERVQRATRGIVGLAGLVVVSLSAWALGEIVRGRARPIAWSTALWYAHGLFRDYISSPPHE